MTHYMKLNAGPFALMAGGLKTIELRLNDEKRQTVQIGDRIVFSNASNENEQITVQVVDLHRFGDFAELYTSLPLDTCGYLPEQMGTASPADMDAYYSAEQQARYGVLGIEVTLVPAQACDDAD